MECSSTAVPAKKKKLQGKATTPVWGVLQGQNNIKTLLEDGTIGATNNGKTKTKTGATNGTTGATIQDKTNAKTSLPEGMKGTSTNGKIETMQGSHHDQIEE